MQRNNSICGAKIEETYRNEISELLINYLHQFQNRALRNIVYAPWYIRNEDLQGAFHVRTIKEEIKIVARDHEKKLYKHFNVEVFQFLGNQNL